MQSDDRPHLLALGGLERGIEGIGAGNFDRFEAHAQALGIALQTGQRAATERTSPRARRQAKHEAGVPSPAAALASISDHCPYIPVTLPPGRRKLSIRPSATGSYPCPPTITIGIVLVAFIATRVDTSLGATITSTLRRTISEARSGRRSS